MQDLTPLGRRGHPPSRPHANALAITGDAVVYAEEDHLLLAALPIADVATLSMTAY